MNTYVLKRRLAKIISYTFFTILAIIVLLPIYMLLINATRSTEAINAGLALLPSGALADNWAIINGFGINIPQGVINSSIISFSTTFLTVYFSLLTAYAISVYNFRFKRFLYGFILAMNMVPMGLYLLGFFQYMHAIGLLNTRLALIIPAVAAPGAVFFFKQYLDATLVPELIQAARIDGASEFGIFNRIVLPIAAPGAFTMAIFAFVGSWNSFMGPLFIIGGDSSLHTLPIIMSRLQGDAFRTDYGAVYLSMVITLIPILIVYAIFSKHIISGIAMGSVKE